MKSFISLILALVFCSGQSYAQYRIDGSISDTLNATQLVLSSVVLIRASDSVLEDYTRTANDGSFSLHARTKGKYLLQIAHPGYADFADIVMVNDTVVHVYQIPMLSKEHMLKEFKFTQQVAAIKIKGDTTEYVADSFHVKTGASVEDLLKRLPGIQVDKNGKITAQGTEVQKVLVDGEEFFSDDPKVVTQGLQAAVVDKVQVFDKKSDQAEFTGIEDGEKTRTINLQLKEDKKKGFFGKLEGGAGTDNYYQNQAMINAFKGKRQLAAFGIVSNTDKVGLGWQENERYGGSSNISEVSDDGSWTMYVDNYDDFGGWDGNYSGDGLPLVRTGGGHFANKWNEDKQHASASYRYAQQQVNIGGSNIKMYLLGGDTSRVNNESKKQFNTSERHAMSGLYEWTIDTLTSIKLRTDGNLKHIMTNSTFRTEIYNIVDSVADVSTINDRTLSSSSDEAALNADLLIRRKFSKKGRTLSIDLKEKYKEIEGEGYLLSTTGISGMAPYDSLDQKKQTSSVSQMFTAKANYTEPLSKVLFAEASYSYSQNNNTAANLSSERPGVGGGYDVLQDSFSSRYRYNVGINRGGLGIRYVDKKLNLSAGSEISNTSFLQTDLLRTGVSNKYTYLNFFPRAAIVYKIKRQTSVRLSYQGSTAQPTIQQIQPLNQNIDPLNIVIGNPDLKQKFVNNFNVRFNNYKTLKEQYLYMGATINVVSDDISTAQRTEGPTYITQYINVDGNYHSNWYAGYRFKLKKPALNLWVHGNGNNGRTNSVVNGEKNTSVNNSYTIGPGIGMWKEDKYDISLTPGVTYTDNRATVSAAPVNYWSMNNEFSAEVELPGKVEIATSVTHMLRQKTIVFTDNNSNVRWNAHISKRFLKKKELMVKLSVFDILNQNLGYTRSASGNVVTQNSYNTIKRYGLLTIVWNFTHSPMGGAPTDNDDE